MKLKYNLILLLFMLIIGQIHAQNTAFDRKAFPNNKVGLQAAQGDLKNGNKLYEKGDKISTDMALEFFLNANKFNPNNAELNYKIGQCYLRDVKKASSIQYFEKALKLNPSVNPDLLYYLGRAYHYGYEFDLAINTYKSFKNKLSGNESSRVKEIDKLIRECETGKVLVANPERVFTDNISELNTNYPEYGPVISADESMLVFTSCRPSTTGGDRDKSTGVYFEDIYFSNRQARVWQPATNPGKPLNSDSHDAIIGLSNDGQKIFIYKTDNNGDIFMSNLKGDTWSRPKSIGNKVNSKYHESQASLSFDGKTLYFVSNRPGGFGEHDIYVSQLDAKGNWGDPVNLGATINTEHDELSIFIHPDDKTLYFSSKGHNTMGGFDIFKSVHENGAWGKPVNMGYPINTPDNDLFFSLSANGRFGYYSSIRENGKGDHDLYMLTFLGPEKQLINNSEDMLIAFKNKPVSEKVIESAVKLPSADLTLLRGVVRDDETKEPIEADIILVDNNKNIVIATLQSNSKTGRYLVSLPSGINYGIAVKAENYLFHSENFEVPASSGYQEVTKDVDMKKIDIGSKIVLRNIFFDTGKSTLRPESIYELTQLVNLLTEMPKLKIELSGHTDNRGSETLNKKLSEERAKSVVDHLIAQKIDASRLTYKGYGFDEPVATNDNEAGRQLNRRTEFKVMEIK